MGECVEKIYCCGCGNNDNALAAAILANGRRDTGELRNGRRDLGFAITQGFSSTACLAIYSSLTVTITPAAASSLIETEGT